MVLVPYHVCTSTVNDMCKPDPKSPISCTCTLDWAALFVLDFVPCVSLAYCVYTRIVDSTVLCNVILCLLTDAAIVTKSCMYMENQ